MLVQRPTLPSPPHPLTHMAAPGRAPRPLQCSRCCGLWCDKKRVCQKCLAFLMRMKVLHKWASPQSN
ncbi:hypothetical protein E2C01_009396 [Portunus trituberculatus]|uniref:Uncharacterized protein n=1 Tax=Portunus trituberculatus TaxID=210409 RepID=A0A5B7D3F0_PORTR|nr:hypothetical protein [Portunus trituberculatus]